MYLIIYLFICLLINQSIDLLMLINELINVSMYLFIYLLIN